jgi:hypothetical protein
MSRTTRQPQRAAERSDPVRIGVLADPGLPTELAEDLVSGLPRVLDGEVGDGVDWQVARRGEPIVLDERGLIPVASLAEEYKQANGWDVMLVLTDLPRRSGTRPTAAAVSRSLGVGVLSVPALGALGLRRRMRRLVVDLVRLLIGDRQPGGGRQPPEPGAADRAVTESAAWLAPVRYVPSDDPDIDGHVALVGLRGRLRLLAGMVRDNRPWRLVPHLSSATAAAVATSAYITVTITFWQMSGWLSVTRLVVINLVAVAAMTAWLIFYNGLWDRPSDRRARSGAVLYNIATLVTLLLGVTCMYLLLYAATLLAAMALVEPDHLASVLRRPTTAGDHLRLVWLASSIGIVAGALGSSMESEDAVRDATYGRRERQRRRDADPDDRRRR